MPVVDSNIEENSKNVDRKRYETNGLRNDTTPFINRKKFTMADTAPTLTVGGDRTTGQSVRTQNGLFL